MLPTINIEEYLCNTAYKSVAKLFTDQFTRAKRMANGKRPDEEQFKTWVVSVTRYIPSEPDKDAARGKYSIDKVQCGGTIISQRYDLD